MGFLVSKRHLSFTRKTLKESAQDNVPLLYLKTKPKKKIRRALNTDSVLQIPKLDTVIDLTLERRNSLWRGFFYESFVQSSVLVPSLIN